MIALAIFCSLLGIFFMREAAKEYNRHDPFMNFIPMAVSTVLMHLAGVCWVFYLSKGW